jgi:hypothetical protein
MLDFALDPSADACVLTGQYGVVVLDSLRDFPLRGDNSRHPHQKRLQSGLFRVE